LLREPEEPLVSVTSIVFFYIKDDPLHGTEEKKDEPRVKQQKSQNHNG